jgi:hypothetical protein
MDKHMPLVIAQGREIVQVARVRQLVDINDGLVAQGQPVKYEIRTDKTGTTSNNNHSRK